MKLNGRLLRQQVPGKNLGKDLHVGLGKHAVVIARQRHGVNGSVRPPGRGLPCGGVAGGQVQQLVGILGQVVGECGL